MRYALIDKATGIVKGVILWNGEAFYPIADGFELVALSDTIAGPGWSYINGEFVAPEPA